MAISFLRDQIATVALLLRNDTRNSVSLLIRNIAIIVYRVLDARFFRHGFVLKIKNINLWFWLAVPFLVLNGFFVANLRVYPELQPFADHPAIAIVSSVFVLVFAAPSFFALVKWLERRGVYALLALGVFALCIESFAVATGFPYGQFSYGEKIGTKIFGLVPWTVMFAWTPILLASYALARRSVGSRESAHGAKMNRGQRWTLAIATALWTVAFDLVLDAGAVSQGFWSYQNGGAWYNVPFSNFVGWILSGTIGAFILQSFAQWHTRDLPPRNLLGSAWLLMIFWTSVCAFSGLWWAAAQGVLMLAVIFRVCCFSRN